MGLESELDQIRPVEESVASGKEARKTLPREAHAEFENADSNRDPVGILTSQDAVRVAELVPIRYGRMLTTPFAFYRGSAALMSEDLGAKPHSGLFAQLCGDAHLSNFGLFAAPDRRLIFDLNDFDETLPGPWEWDLKRLAVSVAIAMRSIGGSKKDSKNAVMATVATYRARMKELAGQGNLDVWYARMEIDKVKELLTNEPDKKVLKALNKASEKAQTRDSHRDLEKLTHVVDGQRRIMADPPLIVPVEDLLADTHHGSASPEEIRERIAEMLKEYSKGLATDRRHLLNQYTVAHMARKVVGVGSVGTRAWIILLIGRDDSDPLFLQIKEAGPSVLERYLGPSEYEFAGQRVIAGQRIMQAATDVLIGWQNTTGVDGVDRQFYVRQLKDWKGSADIEKMLPHGLELYGSLCGRVLARAHARSGDRVAINAYLGKSDKFDKALAEYSELYADQNDRDYARLQQAVADGVIEAQNGI
jgi:uncharacterized protein (DUF2252 family)